MNERDGTSSALRSLLKNQRRIPPRSTTGRALQAIYAPDTLLADRFEPYRQYVLFCADS